MTFSEYVARVVADGGTIRDATECQADITFLQNNGFFDIALLKAYSSKWGVKSSGGTPDAVSKVYGLTGSDLSPLFEGDGSQVVEYDTSAAAPFIVATASGANRGWLESELFTCPEDVMFLAGSAAEVTSANVCGWMLLLEDNSRRASFRLIRGRTNAWDEEVDDFGQDVSPASNMSQAVAIFHAGMVDYRSGVRVAWTGADSGRTAVSQKAAEGGNFAAIAGQSLKLALGRQDARFAGNLAPGYPQPFAEFFLGVEATDLQIDALNAYFQAKYIP